MAPKRASKKTHRTGRAPKASGSGGSTGGPVRLQRVLAAAGFGSRRQCEELITAGRVEVDGEPVTRLGTTVDPETAKVRVDGDLLKKRKLVYYAVNKPVGVVTTNRDPQGRPRVVDLVPPDERVFPVGRLDRNSEGLILLTNDGELAQRLTHPKFGVRKVYRVTVAGKVDGETMKQMRRGIYIAEGHVRVEGAKVLKSRSRSTEMEIVLREGKNREIRRILARLGHKVQHLRRIAVGPLRLGDLPSGAYRVVKRNEVEKLWQVTEAESAGEQVGRKRATKKRSTKKQSPKQSRGRKGAKPNQRPFSSPGEISSDTTIGAVIGGDSPETTERNEPSPGRRRKVVKPQRGRSAKKKRTSKKSSPPQGRSRRSVKPASKSSRSKTVGRKKSRPAKQARRKRN